MDGERRWPGGGEWRAVDTGVYEGGEIPMFYDSMIAKLIVHGGPRRGDRKMRGRSTAFVIRGISATSRSRRRCWRTRSFVGTSTPASSPSTTRRAFGPRTCRTTIRTSCWCWLARRTAAASDRSAHQRPAARPRRLDRRLRRRRDRRRRLNTPQIRAVRLRPTATGRVTAPASGQAGIQLPAPVPMSPHHGTVDGSSPFRSQIERKNLGTAWSTTAAHRRYGHPARAPPTALR